MSFPFACSSRILSYTKTFASTAIPIVKTIPAIPASVKTAPNEASVPKIKMMFANKAISATIPAFP